jgi:nucleotide-binding universal stress UspA family protein
MMFKKILCPVDFSTGSREAMEVAARMAVESSATLVLEHVWDMSGWAISELMLAPVALQDLLDSCEAELVRWQRDARAMGVRTVETRSESGAPWERITAVCNRDPDIDLVVMGTHGRTGLQHVVLGSVAERVVRHAPCPVLVVRDHAGRGAASQNSLPTLNTSAGRAP